MRSHPKCSRVTPAIARASSPTRSECPPRRSFRLSASGRYIWQDTGLLMSHIAQGPRVQPHPLTLSVDFVSAGCQPVPCSQPRLTFRRNRLVTCSAAARNASSKGRPLRARRGTGSNRGTTSAAVIPGLYFTSSMRTRAIRKWTVSLDTGAAMPVTMRLIPSCELPIS
jgi:hypothetical protein